MSASWLLLLGCLVGLVQLVLGMGIGIWLARPRRAAADTDGDHEQARELAQRLSLLTGSLNYNVEAHRSRIGKLKQQLELAPADTSSPLTDLVVGVVREMVNSTQELQQQLTSAQEELQRQSEEIEIQISQAMTDALTGLANRRAFDEQVQVHLTNWRDHRIPFSLLIIDLDHFKKINDTYGHVVGDEILAAAAGALRAALRRPDIVARFGGEEFAIILPFTPLEKAVQAVHKGLHSVAGAVVACEDELLNVTASGGLATIRPGEDAESLIRRADAALYAAKQAGRDRAYLHDGSAAVAIDPLSDADPDADGQIEFPDLPPLTNVHSPTITSRAMGQATSELKARLAEVLATSDQPPTARDRR